jgi:hypothetical protein
MPQGMFFDHLHIPSVHPPTQVKLAMPGVGLDANFLIEV